MTCQGIAVLNHTFIDITSIPWVITSNPLVLWVSLRSYMDQKFPLYILYLSIARKFAAVHEPSPLDLEEADMQISLCEQIVPCIHLFTRQTFPLCLLCARKCGWHKQDIQQLFRASVHSHRKSMCMHACMVTQSCPALCEPVDYSPSGSSVCGILQQEHCSGLPFPPTQGMGET